MNMTDEQLLKSAQLIQIDPETGKSGITLAGVMLFGTDSQILQVCPPHRTDCILRKKEDVVLGRSQDGAKSGSSRNLAQLPGREINYRVAAAFGKKQQEQVQGTDTRASD
jgi:predicted HTH transcriptional regulator